jgi:hypothetical protein
MIDDYDDDDDDNNNNRLNVKYLSVHPTKTEREVEVQHHSFLTSLLTHMRGYLHASAAFFPGNYTGTHWVAGQVFPRTGLDMSEKRKLSFSSRDSRPDRSARKLVAIPTTLFPYR